ncbi:MAG: exo-alpha-sialidase [Planctomycetaceae bacterium]|nr:exo-alpha-sialidase [Planctomycetaceae bacterium]
MRSLLFLFCFVIPLSPHLCAEEMDVFVSGEGGYHTYRIPAIIRTQKGTLIAFAEGRKSGRGDSGNIDLVYKRSFDDGKNWSEMKVLWDDGGNTCGNPCPVIDAATGRIVLPLTWNHGDDHESEIKKSSGKDTRRVYLSWSNDDGETWVDPQEITDQAKEPAWTWYATGPGNGIQLQQGEHKGRLVIPCDHNILVGEESVRRSHCILSDDGGKTWRMSEPLERDTNECAVVELSDGRLLLNMRSYHGKNLRAISYSEDGGETWSGVLLDPELIEPVCQASLITLDDGDLAFSNPASTKRDHMTLKLSENAGKSWSAHEIYPGSAAYSSLVNLGNSSLGLLYEKDGYSRIVFRIISVESLR